MLMFLGEYFKAVIVIKDQIHSNIENKDNNKQNKIMEQDSYFITKDIMNSLGTAAK